MPLKKQYTILLLIVLSVRLNAQDESSVFKSYAISDIYFVDYLGFIKPNLAVVPCNGGVFSPNWHSWYFKTQDTILSVEPSYQDTSLVMTRTSRNLFEIVKVPINGNGGKITPLVLTKGFIFYTVPSNFIKDLNFYVVGYNNKFNICRLYNHKVDTLFICDSMITQLEVVDKSTLIFCYNNKLLIYPLNEKPFVLFDADKYNIYGFTTDNKGCLYVSIDPGIIKIENFNQFSLISTGPIKGKLRYFDGKLYVLDAEKRNLSVILMKSVNYVQLTAPTERSQEKYQDEKFQGILTNSAIINMVKAKLADGLIIDLINNSRVNFNTTVDSMIYLSNQNVSSQIIMAMRNAMKVKSKSKVGTDGNVSDNKITTNNQAAQNINTSETYNIPVNRFYIITGSYPTEQQAGEAVADLKRKGFTGAEIVGINSSGGYRIACKGYATNEEAVKDLPEVKKTVNSTAWILEKK